MILSRRNSNSPVARSAEVTLRTVPAAFVMLVAAVSVPFKQGFFNKRGAGASDFIERIRVRDGGRARRIVAATSIIALGVTCANWAGLSPDASPDRVIRVTRSPQPPFYFPS